MLMRIWSEWQFETNVKHAQETHMVITNAAAQGNSTPTSGVMFDLSWYSERTATDYGTTRPSIENRVNWNAAATGIYIQRHTSSLIHARA
jgi:hypothetical protein